MLAFAALGHEPIGAPPRGEEAFLHGVLRELLVAEHAQRQAVGDAAEPVVELRQRLVVRSRDKRDDCLVG